MKAQKYEGFFKYALQVSKVVLVDMVVQLSIGWKFEECFDQPVSQVIHPAVDMGCVSGFPGMLNNGCFGQVVDLFDHIQLYESV
jgi:hypothetical protein